MLVPWRNKTPANVSRAVAHAKLTQVDATHSITTDDYRQAFFTHARPIAVKQQYMYNIFKARRDIWIRSKKR